MCFIEMICEVGGMLRVGALDRRRVCLLERCGAVYVW